MKRFLLVFEDLMQSHVLHEGVNEPTSRAIEANSRKELIDQLGLVACHKNNKRAFWDGKNNAVLIFIYEMNNKTVASRAELNEYVFKLSCDWY